MGEEKMIKNSATAAALTASVLICLIASGCDSINRKHFTKLQPTKVQDGKQHFTYLAATGSAMIVCAPKTKCSVTTGRPAIWPIDDEQAEKTRMQWLAEWLAENGYEETDYQILSRQIIAASDYSASRALYDISYNVSVPLKSVPLKEQKTTAVLAAR
jgi:hypothetical protein